MKAKAIIAMITTKVKSILQERAEQREASLTVENAGIVVDVIQEAVFAPAHDCTNAGVQDARLNSFSTKYCSGHQRGVAPTHCVLHPELYTYSSPVIRERSSRKTSSTSQPSRSMRMSM